MNNDIILKNVTEGNLKNISINIPRNKLVVLTGVSGSGKSTLAVDVIFKECQRQYLEAMSMQGIRKPKLEKLINSSPTILIGQYDYNHNSRSTVGTMSDIYTSLRMIYEKLHVRRCPHCHKLIQADECKEELEKSDDDFIVYMYCPHCNHKMEKLTRSHFSYNTTKGACPNCKGRGKHLTVNFSSVIDENLCIEEGGIKIFEYRYLEYQFKSLLNAYQCLGIDYQKNTKIKDFNKIQKEVLLNGIESPLIKEEFPNLKLPKTVEKGKFVGLIPYLNQKIKDSSKYEKYFNESVCKICHGEKLNELSLNATVMDTKISQLSNYSLNELNHWIIDLKNNINQQQYILIKDYILDIETKINRIINVGLDYLTLNRHSSSLSGGEYQRIKLAAALDSKITGIIYILDEPTKGLHSNDTLGIIKILKELRDLDNTVIVIEHDNDVIKEADYIIDLGIGSGKHGGNIVVSGSLKEILKCNNSLTAQYLLNKVPIKQQTRCSNQFIHIKNAYLHNLKNINVDLPLHQLVCVTGVSGSGKSTLIFEILAKYLKKGQLNSCDKIEFDEKFDDVIVIHQNMIARSIRSNVATYSGIYDDIRNFMAKLDKAKEQKLTAKDFSFNSKGGRCENCQGLGFVESNLLFFENVEVTCPVCQGKQFEDHVLEVKFKGYSIHDLLHLSIDELIDVFEEYPKIKNKLQLLNEAGVGYLELGQSLKTLSGGESQRLKLAKALLKANHKNCLYLIDEPTTGLHGKDVEHFLVLLNKLIEANNSIIVVEHHLDVIRQSDYIIDLGPGGGIKGGKVVYSGTPEKIKNVSDSLTGKFL